MKTTKFKGLSIHAEVHGTGGAESRTSCLRTGGGSTVTISESPKSVKLLISSLHNDLSFKNPLRLLPFIHLVYLLILTN
jgi:hypothetical protein